MWRNIYGDVDLWIEVLEPEDNVEENDLGSCITQGGFEGLKQLSERSRDMLYELIQ